MSWHILYYNNIIFKIGLSGPSSAFEKWSGHVEPKGSCVGCLGISPRKNWIHPFPEAIL